MGKKQLEKAKLIGLPPMPAAVPAPPAVSGLPVLNRSTPAVVSERPKTAPGTMLGFMTAQSGAVQEAESLRARLKAFEGSTPVKLLDPQSIVPSKWANRHVANFVGKEFESLKAEIQQAGGNVQPIKVRPKGAVLNGSTGAVASDFEVVYGHRRHRACLELGIPVLAQVEETSDAELFGQMERENRGRQNLSAWEQGSMYNQALDEGLFPSQRKLAEVIGVDVSMVSKSVALAKLPAEVVDAFPSPLEIQYRWAQPLSEARQKDPDGLLTKARALKSEIPRPSAARVFAVLSGAEALNRSTPAAKPSKDIAIERRGAKVATLTSDAKGRALVRFESNALPDSKRGQLAKLIRDFLGET
jgi:ParB family transcriptional regulator, chromosome partitioning protein